MLIDYAILTRYTLQIKIFIGNLRNINIFLKRVLLTLILISIKFNEDEYFANSFYANVGGISLKELNNLELETFRMLDHNLFVSPDFYFKYYDNLLNYNK